MADEWSPFKMWSLTAVRDWASANFPDAFAALPGIDDVEFVELDDDMMDISPFRLPTNTPKKLLCIGIWDGFPCDPQDRVFAFPHGPNHSQVGYIREDSHVTPKRYRRLGQAEMKKVDVEEPLCYIADGTERATLTRLGTLVLFYFVAAGHILQFRGDESFTREFEKACLYIEHGWPKTEGLLPGLDQPSSQSQIYSADAGSDHDLPETESVLAKLEELGEFRSDDAMGASS
ncbi:hypothetical protein P171DRAFT_492537, partial [Karstenula rhodostoma CBS 690.94]